MRRPFACCVLALFAFHAAMGEEPWVEALCEMPLPGGTNPVERNNVVRRILEGLQPNGIVKAIVVLPAVSDDLYLINRDQPPLHLRATNLWQAIAALTNTTEIHGTFKSPFLLIHRDEDFLEPRVVIKDVGAVERLKSEARLPHALFCDVHWEKLRPPLNKALRPSVLPWSTSREAWHFARHNLAGWSLSDWELLLAVSLTGKTALTVEKRRVHFERRVTR